MGFLYGGVSVVFIELIGFIGFILLLDFEKEVFVGIEINVNYIGGMCFGMVKVIGRIVYVGKWMYFW